MGLFDGFQFDPQSYGGDGGLQGLLARLMPQAQQPQAPTQGIGNPDMPSSYQTIGQQQFPVFGTADPAALPPNAQPAQGQMPAQAPQQQQSPQASFLPSSDVGVGDRFNAGLAGLVTNAHTGPIGALLGGLGGLVSGKRADPQYLAQQTQRATFQSLRDAGMPANIAMAATLNPEILKQIAPQYFAKPQLQEMGNDPLSGKKTFGIWDPVEQTLKPVGGQAGATDAGGGSMDALQKAQQAGVQGEALYQYLPQGMQGAVKAMIEGRQPMPSTQAMRSPAILAMIDAAHSIDPTFDATSWQQRVAGQKDFYGGGKSAEMTRAANQTLHHVGQLLTSMDDLNNGQMPALNSVGNFVSEQFGSGAQGAFRTNAHAVAEEMSKVFKGANLSDAEIRSWEQNLHENMSPEQQTAQVLKLRDLLQGSLHALEEKRVSSIGPMAAAKAGPLIQEEGQKVLQKIDDWAAGKRSDTPQSANATVKDGSTATNPKTGAKLIMRGGQWVPAK